MTLVRSNEGLNRNSHRQMGIKGQTEEMLKRESRQDLVRFVSEGKESEV